MLAAGVGTVLLTRGYLAATGYPQVGGGSLHIAHALWGGLLLLAGLLGALAFVGNRSRRIAAVVGGVGLGLFVDEVGKFVTQTNNYFFRPAAAIIYALFVALALVVATARSARQRTPAARRSAAASIAAAGLAEGLTPQQRDSLDALLAGDDDPVADAVRQLAAAAPSRLPSNSIEQRCQPVVRRLRSLVRRDGVVTGVLMLFVVSRIIVAMVFWADAAPVLAGHSAGPGHDDGALVAGAITRTVEAILAVVGALCWSRRRHIAIWAFGAALAASLLVGQLFNFTDSQFVAITELPFLIVVLAVVWAQAIDGRPDGGDGRHDRSIALQQQRLRAGRQRPVGIADLGLGCADTDGSDADLGSDAHPFADRRPIEMHGRVGVHERPVAGL
jgi:hypothetical protein